VRQFFAKADALLRVGQRVTVQGAKVSCRPRRSASAHDLLFLAGELSFRDRIFG
jgi:hypothetical protein